MAWKQEKSARRAGIENDEKMGLAVDRVRETG